LELLQLIAMIFVLQVGTVVAPQSAQLPSVVQVARLIAQQVNFARSLGAKVPDV